MTQTCWIAADWGSSNLRIWAIGAEGEVIAERASDQGMGVLEGHEFEPAFLDLTDDLLGPGPCDVLICGMAGARQGWVEAPYNSVPCKPSETGAVRVVGSDSRLNVRILPGLSQAKPPDVMRGEETQVAGLLAGEPGFDGIVCLPGTHTKWVHVSAGEVVSFRTFMTGELFDLLSRKSMLRHSLGAGWDGPSFVAAVADAISRPERVASELFSIRAASLLSAPAPDLARSRLSGLLIGLELAGTRPYWLGQRVVLIGEDKLCGHYAEALKAQGVQTEQTSARDMTLAGLASAYGKLTGGRP